MNKSKQNQLPARPNLPEMEEVVLLAWEKNQAFEKSVEMRPASKPYVFYDGPPFATGLPHYGHLLASTTKDVVPRYWTMKGYRVERVWGWDCHGLPIEHMIEKKLDIKGGKKGIEELGVAKFNQACRSEVLRLDKEWKKIINRLGRWVDFDNNYKTMDQSYMESVWWGFKQLFEKGLVYQGRKVILYCPRCSTPLSNFEIAMDNSYQEVTESSTVYKYPVKDQKDTFLLAWSTTPWNKLATPALAVNPNMEYVKVKQDGEFYLLAKNTLDILKDSPYEIVEELTGTELSKLEFVPHFDFYPNRKPDEKIGVILADEFVTDDEGTGVVTLAVYGEDDYRVMSEAGVQLVEHVDDEGKLKKEVGEWAGMDILAANSSVNEDLDERGLIYLDKPHTHSVATCYRCGTRLYYAPLPAWFINIASMRNRMIELNEEINWVPNHLKHGRFLKGLENAPDWNISRSRYWGTPMPIWSAVTTDDGRENEQFRIVGSIEELKKWAVEPEQVDNLEDIHPEFLTDIEVWIDDEKTLKGKRIPEVFDCWVESGSMPFAHKHYPFENKPEFDQAFPGQFVSEYIAQTRAWFYTMHVMSTAIFDQPPFENVLTTGTILAQDGTKMSKSKKNYPDPTLLIDKYGADSLRMYLMSSTVMKSENLNFNESEVNDIYKKVFMIWYNMVSFYQLYVGNKVDLYQNFEPGDLEDTMDQWILSKLNRLVKDVTTYMDAYDLVRASRELMSFVGELSTWYLRRSRERLKENEMSQKVYGAVLLKLAQLFAPFAPFFSEWVFGQLVNNNDKVESSIHHSDWPEYQLDLIDDELEKNMEIIRKAVEKAHAQRKEEGVKLRQPLSRVIVKAPVPEPSANVLEVLTAELNVKAVDWSEKEGEVESVLDLRLSEELKSEGEARELVRNIQKLRKKAGLAINDETKVEAPDWPSDWQEFIENSTNSKLTKGEELRLY